MDFEEGKNQWFRGPVKPMTTADLQKNVDSHLGTSGDNGRFKITVAKEGMIWTANQTPRYSSDENITVGNTFKIENEKKVDKLKLTIEDSINRYTLQFDRPRRNRNNNQLVQAAAEKEMLARGPELTMELFTPQSKEKEPRVVKIRALKGKKHVFRDDILINDLDVLRQTIKKSFSLNIPNCVPSLYSLILL
jgi:hypothetical protein